METANSATLPSGAVRWELPRLTATKARLFAFKARRPIKPRDPTCGGKRTSERKADGDAPTRVFTGSTAAQPVRRLTQLHSENQRQLYGPLGRLTMTKGAGARTPGSP